MPNMKVFIRRIWIWQKIIWFWKHQYSNYKVVVWASLLMTLGCNRIWLWLYWCMSSAKSLRIKAESCLARVREREMLINRWISSYLWYFTTLLPYISGLYTINLLRYATTKWHSAETVYANQRSNLPGREKKAWKGRHALITVFFVRSEVELGTYRTTQWKLVANSTYSDLGMLISYYDVSWGVHNSMSLLFYPWIVSYDDVLYKTTLH